jgi:hypothetical protein
VTGHLTHLGVVCCRIKDAVVHKLDCQCPPLQGTNASRAIRAPGHDLTLLVFSLTACGSKYSRSASLLRPNLLRPNSTAHTGKEAKLLLEEIG